MNTLSSLPSAWLVSDGRVLASANIADTARAKRRGLIGQQDLQTALVIAPCRWIHTVGMRFALDIAYLDSEGTVIKVQRVIKNRVPLPVFSARTVIEAKAGSFERWGLQLGATVEMRSS
jgi:uncharacterized membrane protein (UPF0127 family)